MKIYTRTGDDGTTGLFGAGRVSKDHIRIEAIGAIDEINAAIGCAQAWGESDAFMPELLANLQHDLFVLGADLATPLQSRANTQRITADHVNTLEHNIDKVGIPLKPLKNFVLPGGTYLAALLHSARVTCRRAERRIVTLSESEKLNVHLLHYLNRLSDLLFTMARRANHDANTPDIHWIQK